MILAGGRSRRMGRDKALLPVGDSVLIDRVIAAVIAVGLEPLIVGRSALPTHPQVRCIPDADPDQGPASGVRTALDEAAGGAVLVLPCDLPQCTPALLEWLRATWDAHGLPPVWAGSWDGDLHPLPGIYGPQTREHLHAGGSLRQVFAHIPGCSVEVPAALRRSYLDLDTPEDAARYGLDADRDA